MGQSKIAVIGAGSWGTALSQVLAQSGHIVHLWDRDETLIKEMEKEKINRRYHPNTLLHKGIQPKLKLEQAFQGVDFILYAAPSHAFRDFAPQFKKLMKKTNILINTAKGIDGDSLGTLVTVAKEFFEKDWVYDHYAVLSGP